MNGQESFRKREQRTDFENDTGRTNNIYEGPVAGGKKACQGNRKEACQIIKAKSMMQNEAGEEREVRLLTTTVIKL